jgi:hypothetical protein
MTTQFSRIAAAACAAWLCAAPTLAAEPNASQRSQNEKLVGNWRVLSFKWKILATGDTHDAYGKAPKGFINYGRDGRALALIVAEGRPRPTDVSKMTAEHSLQLLRSVIAWGGTYDFDGKTVTHHVDMSATEAWTGTDQVRTVQLEGNRLTLTTPPMIAPDGTEGVAVTILERTDAKGPAPRG